MAFGSAQSLSSRAFSLLRGFFKLNRGHIAVHYLRGEGIEIGALHNPLRVHPRVRVRYVDRMSTAELRTHYPELRDKNLVPVDIIDDGESLRTIGSETQQFVIANHFLEHCENPVQTLVNLSRVLKPGGILYLAVPDKRKSFDRDRPVTSFEHIERDYRDGPEWSRAEHFLEWTRLVEKIDDPDQAAKHAAELSAKGYSIHFHVWSLREFLEFVLKLRTMFAVPLEVEMIFKNDSMEEIVAILRKTAPIH